MKEAYDRGLATRVGARNPRALLTERQVLWLRERRRDGFSAVSGAQILGIKATTARQAANGKNWKHL
jgi:hypothetical protein